MDALEDWLTSIENRETMPATIDTDRDTSENTTPQELSSEDFDSILNDYGFESPEEAQAEEIEFRPEEVENQIFEVNIDSIDHEISANDVTTENPVSEDVEDTLTENRERPLITPNSPTLLMDESTSRFSGAEWFNEIQKKNITIAGIGGIGSWLTLLLARIHPDQMNIYDNDVVEAANLSGQLFSHQDIGNSKVAAICETVHKYTTMDFIVGHNLRYTESSTSTNIMMCGFDNMEARKLYFESWRNHVGEFPHKEECLFLDGRLSMDTLQVFCITGDNEYACKEYADKYLFSSAEADETVCSLKQTTYMACMIASIMTNLFVNWVANSLNPIIPYDLPFFTEYDAQNMIFKTLN